MPCSVFPELVLALAALCGSPFQKVRDLLPGLLGDLHERRGALHVIVFVEESDGCTGGSGPPGTADPMNIGLYVPRHIKVNDVGHTLDHEIRIRDGSVYIGGVG